MRQLAAALALVWGVLNAIIGAFFVTGAFTATTARKEGLAAEAALLIGGVLIGVFSWLLAQQSWRLFQQKDGQ